MQEEGLYPDPKIFVTVISRLGEQGKWNMIQKTFENMKRRGHKKSGTIYAALVDIYGQYGKFKDAEACISALKAEVKVLQLMEAGEIELNVIMLNVLMNAFGVAGFSPDVVMYTTLMKAYIRARRSLMEHAGCTPNRKARKMLQVALMVLQQRNCE
ncbi:hypothetical protein L3X38_001687 [Prunus dulcis]|uniref:Tetratricopeptide repeat-like superfamily protein n=1 Tax=Prunus dulcis TaxID=3755 RepID=A0AAD4WSH5_PRUDU|nr:hypothetical protein L3X38_001687 [Prunus dulcis]